MLRVPRPRGQSVFGREEQRGRSACILYICTLITHDTCRAAPLSTGHGVTIRCPPGSRLLFAGSWPMMAPQTKTCSHSGPPEGHGAMCVHTLCACGAWLCTLRLLAGHGLPSAPAARPVRGASRACAIPAHGNSAPRHPESRAPSTGHAGLVIAWPTPQQLRQSPLALEASSRAVDAFPHAGTLSETCTLRPCKDVYNVVDQAQRVVTRRVNPGAGGEAFRRAWRPMQGDAAMPLIVRGRGTGPRRVTLCHRIASGRRGVDWQHRRASRGTCPHSDNACTQPLPAPWWPFLLVSMGVAATTLVTESGHGYSG
jgi:hypothetical protein